MGSHNTLVELAEAMAVNPVQDPGASGTLNLHGGTLGYCELTTAGSESRGLPQAEPGTMVLVNQLNAHAVTLTDSDGTAATLAQDECALMLSVGSAASKWRGLLFKYGST